MAYDTDEKPAESRR